MADTPKHKLFFGIPIPMPEVVELVPPSQAAPPAPRIQPWTWDTDEHIFSSGTRTFDSDFDPEYRLGLEGAYDIES